jgi:hypothetical protein
MGIMVDNWLDVSSIIVLKTFGLDPGAECEYQAALLTPAAYSRDIFGNNRTTVVGLTPGLYAVTDGVNAQYFNHYDGVNSIVSPNIWPIPIDVRFGVAAVTFSTEQRDESTGDTTTTMLGCRFVFCLFFCFFLFILLFAKMSRVPLMELYLVQIVHLFYLLDT